MSIVGRNEDRPENQLETANHVLRRKLASMCETIMACVLELEAARDVPQDGFKPYGDALTSVPAKLRAAVLAAT